MQIPPALIVGLGNPGSRYAPTRHNAGFWFVESLAAKLGVTFTAKNAMHGDLATAACRLLRPTTFMNDSGRAVAATAHYYKIPAATVFVAHDEADLPVGKTKLKFGGGDSGHNGIADITRMLGSSDYWRLRIGVGRGDSADISDYVLSRPPATEKEKIDDSIVRILDLWKLIQAGDWQSAMLKLHAPATTTPPPDGN